MSTNPTPFRVVLGVTGSIAAYKAPELIRGLRALRDPQAPDRRIDVRAILTAHGARFITPDTLQTLTGFPVYQELFASTAEWNVEHIGLADTADVLLIAPATANVLAKLALGLADDLLTSVALACQAPLLLAPAMNVHMWAHPATQTHVATLTARGACLIGPDEGDLACGYQGRGRLAPLEEIVQAVAAFVAPRQDLAGTRVLITAGPTREYLDPIRYVTNPSSGKMGYALAAAARARGAQVTLVSGPVTLPSPAGVTVLNVVTTAEMADATLQAAPDADLIIAAAAPADFTPATRAPQKLKKAGRDSLTLEMHPTQDILATLGQRKAAHQVLVGFAAETEHLERYAREKLARKRADMIVANDVAAPDAGFALDTNRAVLLYADGHRHELPMQSKQMMAHRILDAARALMPSSPS
jgi:phosphopantothenoylcysteine decarboxylase/phosphopantothenate--cysteine ligase